MRLTQRSTAITGALGKVTTRKNVHSFMTDNLPANAEQWTDIEGLPFEADDDTVQKDENG